MIARQKSPAPCAQQKTHAAISRGRKQAPYGDHVVNTWSDDGYVYMAACDHPLDNRNVTVYRLGDGTPGSSSYLPNGNVPIPTAAPGDTIHWGFSFQQDVDGATWKATGIISVNGKLYLALTRFIYPGVPGSGNELTTVNAQIFVSSNHGLTWSPTPPFQAAQMASPQFPGRLNSCPAFFNHGQNNNIAVNRSDEFVYCLSNGDPWINSSFRRLGRCPINDFDDVSTAAYWRYYTGGDGMLDSNWSSDGSLASWQGGAGILNMTGTPAYAHASTQPCWYPNYKGGRYIWLANGNFNPQYIQVWESPTPWGPWVAVRAFTIPNSPNPAFEAASTVASGLITGYGDGLSFPNTIASSVNATVDRATAVFGATGDYTSIVAPNFPSPPIDVNEYQLHLLTLELGASSPILVAPTPPGWVPPAGTPIISSISPSSGLVGSIVTITGSNFGSTGTVTFNGVTAATNGWIATSLNATVPIGATSGGVVVTSGGLSSNPQAFTVTSIPSPLITSLTPNMGPVDTVVTVAGSNFGGSIGTSTVTFNGIAASPTGWTPTSITVPVPPTATTGNVIVTVGGVASNPMTFTVGALQQPGDVIQIGFTLYNQLIATSVSTGFNNPVPVTAGSAVVVAWQNFTNHPATSVTDNLGNNYPIEFSQVFPSTSGTGSAVFGMAVLPWVPVSGMLTVTVQFSGVAEHTTVTIAEIAGPIVGVDGHVSAARNDDSSTWSTGSIAVINPSLLIAFGFASKGGGSAVVQPLPPLEWRLFNGGTLNTPANPSIEGYFEVTGYPPANENVVGSAAGLVLLRLS